MSSNARQSVLRQGITLYFFLLMGTFGICSCQTIHMLATDKFSLCFLNIFCPLNDLWLKANLKNSCFLWEVHQKDSSVPYWVCGNTTPPALLTIRLPLVCAASLPSPPIVILYSETRGTRNEVEEKEHSSGASWDRHSSGRWKDLRYSRYGSTILYHTVS